MITLTANGARRAAVGIGVPVELEVDAEIPEGQGTVILVEWDPEGNGDWAAMESAADGTATRVVERLVHTYPEPGTRIAGVRVTSHRMGAVDAVFGRSINLGRARVVVTETE